MSEPKYRDWILETIDSLRSRKARPDLERICRMVRRRYGSDPDRTRSELEKLIQEQTVLKVCYKGSISYRNAAKVQRKSRKKPEQATGSGETVGEQAKHANFNNSAHSPTDTKETVCFAELTEANHYHDLQLKTSAIPKQNDEAVLVPTSGNSCLSCGAAVCQSRARCTAGSGVVKASAPKDKKPPQTGDSGTSVGRDKGNNNSNNNATDASNKIRGARGVQMGLSRHERSSNKGKKTCTLAKASNSHLLRHKQQASLKSKLRVGTKGGSRNGADPNNLDVGDRLVASVRTLAEKSRGVNAATGHTPRRLKEISGFVSSQERLSQEKLTRSKVKVVLEREVVKGRLRKTRFGNVTLPNRGVGPAKRSARLLTSALQSRHTVKKVMDVKPMNIRRREQKDDNVRVKNSQHQGDSGTPSQVEVDTGTPLVQPSQLPCLDAAASLMNPTVDADRKSVSPVLPVMSLPPSSLSSSPSSPPSCATLKHEGSDHEPCVTNGCPVEGMSKELKTETAGDLEEGDSLKLECVPEGTEEMGEGTALCVQVASDLQGVVKMEGDTITSSVSVQTCSEYKMETGEVSCLLTPTASPQDGDVVEERGLNGDVLVKVEKSSQNPVEWTVADVASYFIAAGFPEQAAAFRMQEIDGKSLLLMQRNDVLTGLSIRLGPALKIYERHVKVLQQTHFQDDGALC